jgi:DNA-binding transcriptional LysR family regulator
LKYSKTGEADIKINLASAQIYAANKGLGIIAIPREIPLPQTILPLFPETYVLIDVFAITRREERNVKVDNFIDYVKKYITPFQKRGAPF